jgi:hypothetical protein
VETCIDDRRGKSEEVFGKGYTWFLLGLGVAFGAYMDYHDMKDSRHMNLVLWLISVLIGYGVGGWACLRAKSYSYNRRKAHEQILELYRTRADSEAANLNIAYGERECKYWQSWTICVGALVLYLAMRQHSFLLVFIAAFIGFGVTLIPWNIARQHTNKLKRERGQSIEQSKALQAMGFAVKVGNEQERSKGDGTNNS